ncbi:MAG: tetratricopeptide repeat protein [Chloroflexi bacterium]|jgi:tetratricopeptide (TPR) repeat protein|nr:tetratricopeptide repeat protein [Chloroflexota bacterium]
MNGRQELFQKAMNQGHSAAWDQQWDRAASFYRQALEEKPNHPQALINLGLALFQLQEFDESLQCYKRAAQISPEDPIPLENIAILYERMGELDLSSRASLQAAELYIKNRDITKALENWQRVLRDDPENLQAHSRLALVYERTGKNQQAVSSYLAVASLLQRRGETGKAQQVLQRALKLIPNHPEAVHALALINAGQQLPPPERPRGGTAPYRMSQVRQLEAPQNEENQDNGDPISQARQKALTTLAAILFDVTDEEEAGDQQRQDISAILRGARTAAQNFDSTRVVLHLNQMVDAQTNKQYAQAAEELERAIEAGLDHAAAFFNLGYLQAQIGRQEEAVASLQQALRNPTFTLAAHLLLGSLYQQMNRVREAALEFLEALKIADSQVVDPQFADDLRQLYEPIIETYRQETSEQELSRLCRSISELLLRADWIENLQRARKQLPGRGSRFPVPLAEILTEASSSQMLEAIGKIFELSEQGQLYTAMEEAFFALEQAPNYLPLHTYIGDLLLKENHLAEAVAKYIVVARTYKSRGEIHRAVDLYRKVTQLAPMDLNARKRLIELLVARDQLEEAVQEYIHLAEVYYNLADLEMARKTYKEALRLAQQPRVDRQWRVKILHLMADIDLQSLEWRQALRIFEQIRTLQPDDEPSRLSLIELNYRLGQEQAALAEVDNYINYLVGVHRADQAVVFLEKLVSDYPQHNALRSRLGDAYRLNGRKADALRVYDELGEACLEAGDRAGAIGAVEAILALNPDNKNDYLSLLSQLRTG